MLRVRNPVTAVIIALLMLVKSETKRLERIGNPSISERKSPVDLTVIDKANSTRANQLQPINCMG